MLHCQYLSVASGIMTESTSLFCEQRLIDIIRCINNNIKLQSDEITHPCSKFNDDSTKSPWNLGCWWVIASHNFIWLWLSIHVLNPVMVLSFIVSQSGVIKLDKSPQWHLVTYARIMIILQVIKHDNPNTSEIGWNVFRNLTKCFWNTQYTK